MAFHMNNVSLIVSNMNYFSLLEIPKREGEYAVLTGGNRGIGWHVVKGLVDAGMKVIVGNIQFF